MVFCTKARTPWISIEIENEVHAYLATILKADGNVPIKIGGTDDHVHLLFGLSRTVAIAKVVENLKSSSSKWLKEKRPNFAWQLGYGVFSVDSSDFESVVAYVSDQREHHKAVSFEDEYRSLMRECGISFDERYVWE